MLQREDATVWCHLPWFYSSGAGVGLRYRLLWSAIAGWLPLGLAWLGFVCGLEQILIG